MTDSKSETSIQEVLKRFENFLSATYSQKLQSIMDESKQKSSELLAHARKESRKQAKEYLFAENKKIHEQLSQQELSVELESQAEIEKAQAQLFEMVLENVSKQVADLGTAKRTKLAKSMLEALKAKISQQGLDPKEFSFFGPKDLKLTGVEARLDDLALLAESESIVFEYSLSGYLEEHKDVLFEKTLKQLAKETKVNV